MLKLVIALGIVATLAVVTDSANIFAVYTVVSKSHYVLALPLLKELTRSGHNITVLSIFKTKNLPKENFTEIYIDLPKRIWDSFDGKRYAF